jgi:hypothetical protein
MSSRFSAEPKTASSTPVTVKHENFRLLRYFSIAALLSFTLVGLALYLMERREITFFANVQDGQSKLFREAQAELSSETEQTARRSLVTAQETANVNLTHLIANTMWDTHIAPFLARAQAFSIDSCRAGKGDDERSSLPGGNRRAS